MAYKHYKMNTRSKMWVLLSLLLMNPALIFTQTVPQFEDKFAEQDAAAMLPPTNFSVGIIGGYSDISISGKFGIERIIQNIAFDEANDFYEVKASNNFNFGAYINYYIGNGKVFKIQGKLNYMSRNVTSIGNPKYLVRDTETMDSATLVTEAAINTYYKSFGLDLTAFIRGNPYKTLFLNFGVGTHSGFVFDNESSEYTARILGIEKQGDISLKETDITFSNNSQEISFTNDDEPVLTEIVAGEPYYYGLHITFGTEYYVNTNLAIIFEGTASLDFSQYYKYWDTKLTSIYSYSIGVEWAIDL